MGTLIKRNGSFFPTIPTLFDDILVKNLFNNSDINHIDHSNTFPAVNIQETNTSYELELAAPGMNKDDFDIEISNNKLIVNAHRTKEIEDKGENYTRREFNYQQFQRSFQLPEMLVNEEKIVANYNNGILKITLPKKEENKANPFRRITIS
ncbi:MAG: Hsp20/alpha crystallin family protein [Vicingus serpentipes]|nr:Hsp20/alpha crystallin family protein [Vicingus serpentipes]